MQEISSYEQFYQHVLEQIMNLFTIGTREEYSRDEVLVILGCYRDDPQWLKFIRSLDRNNRVQPPEDS